MMFVLTFIVQVTSSVTSLSLRRLFSLYRKCCSFIKLPDVSVTLSCPPEVSSKPSEDTFSICFSTTGFHPEERSLLHRLWLHRTSPEATCDPSFLHSLWMWRLRAKTLACGELGWEQVGSMFVVRLVQTAWTLCSFLLWFLVLSLLNIFTVFIWAAAACADCKPSQGLMCKYKSNQMQRHVITYLLCGSRGHVYGWRRKFKTQLRKMQEEDYFWCNRMKRWRHKERRD